MVINAGVAQEMSFAGHPLGTRGRLPWLNETASCATASCAPDSCARGVGWRRHSLGKDWYRCLPVITPQ